MEVKKTMKGKRVGYREVATILILVISAFVLFTAVASADGLPCACGDICVNETGWWRNGGDFNASNTPIQHAIDNATVGNIICVKDGTYKENVDVNKRLTIRSQNGSASTTVEALNSDDHVFEVTADYVNISGFTVQNATGGDDAGIYLNSTDHCNISGNNASYNNRGIYLYYSSYNTLTSNNASYNGYYGIYLYYSSYNTLTNNTASYNGLKGILLSSSHYNNLTNNTATSNNYDGIFLDNSDHNRLISNTATGHKPLDGSFEVLILNGGDWEQQGELSFYNYETRQLPLTHDAGTFTLRLSQHGHDAAYVDYVALKKDDTLYLPTSALNMDSTANIWHKIISSEYDVCDAWNSTLEIRWDNVPENTTLVMRAMEEDLGEGHSRQPSVLSIAS